jgi:predicted secreted Zn-dependent protease
MSPTLSIFAFTLAMTLPAQADVTVLEDKIVWYEVGGATVQELRKSMDANTPVSGFDAEAKWWVDWRYQWRTNGQQCVLDNVQVMLRVETTFPRLTSEDGMSTDVLQKWWNYSARLMAHERTHARHGAMAAEEIDRKLKSFTIPGACSDMEDKANAAAMAIIKKANKSDEDYDRRTDHGATEGVVLK